MRPLRLSEQDILSVVHSMLRADLGLDKAFGGSSEPVFQHPVPAPTAAAAADFFGTSPKDFDIGPTPQPDELSREVHRATNGSPDLLFFRTSGSTGTPKRVPQRFSLLIQEILAQAEIHGDRARIVSVVPAHHIYGFLFSVLLPRALNIPCLPLPPLPGSALVRSLHPGDLLVGFPLFFGGLARLALHFPPDLNCVTSTGPCPAQTVHALLEAGARQVCEVYGSSETGGVGWRTDTGAPYSLLSYWERGKGPDELVRNMPEGGRKKLLLPDALDWHGERTFLPLTRVDSAVQVGGVNVYPSRVESVLAGHRHVVECAVRPMRADGGGRLKAFIVLAPGAPSPELVQKELRQMLKQHLCAPERPKHFTFGEVMPTNAMGKRTDWDE